MTKPDLKATVAKLAEVAQRTGGVFVFATRDANLPRGENVSAEIAEYPFAEHTCKECATVFSAVKAEGLQNHCITCGTDKVEAKATSKINIPADPELSYLSCSACGTHNVFASALGKEVAASLCCTACGSGLHATTAAEEAPEGEGEEDDVLDMDDMDMLDLDEDNDGVADDLEIAEKTTTGDPEAPAQPLDPGAPASGNPPESPMVDTPPNPDAKGPSEASAETSAEEDDEDKDDEDDKEESKTVAKAESASFEMIDTLKAEDTISFAYVGKQVAMLSGVKIVATLDPADAGDNADIMQTQAFRQAVAHTINTDGVKAAMAAFGFKSVVVEAPVKAMVDKAVEAALAQDKQKVTAALDSVHAQFEHAVDVAAAGYAGNFWRNKQDPVKAALIAELSSLGIPNAQKVVDRVFAAHGVAQLRDVITLARDLSNKPPEALNGLAQAIDLSKYQPTQVKASDDEEDKSDDKDEDDEEASVTTVATAIDDDEPEAQTASVGTRRFKDPTIAKLLGGSGVLFN